MQNKPIRITGDEIARAAIGVDPGDDRHIRRNRRNGDVLKDFHAVAKSILGGDTQDMIAIAQALIMILAQCQHPVATTHQKGGDENLSGAGCNRNGLRAGGPAQGDARSCIGDTHRGASALVIARKPAHAQLRRTHRKGQSI